MDARLTALLLPGQGAQRERMAGALYGEVPEFTAPMDSFFRALGAEGARLRDEWLRPAPNPALDDALVAQPLLFAVGHALGRWVAATAGGPQVLLGHSAGELAAACLAGVFSPEDGARLMAGRSAALTGGEAGGMLAVAGAPEGLRPLLRNDVAVAAFNGPRQTVLAGPAQPLAETARRLGDAGFTVRPLRSRHAFHSPVLASAADRFARSLSSIGLCAPRTDLWSGRTARRVGATEAVDPRFWADQLALPVLYWPALRALLDAEGTAPGLILLDASADHSLTAPARRHPAVRSGASVVVPLLARPSGDGDDLSALARAREILSERAREAQAAASCAST
ncbi:acyltransferase domain-containing protein [Streptomyces cellulosae]